MTEMKKFLLLPLLLAAGSENVMAQTIEVVYNNETATVNIPSEVTDVISTVQGGHVTLTSTTTTTEYTYHLTGTTTNGSLTINGAYKLTLQLDNVNIKSSKGAAIDVECGKRVAVELVEGTNNVLEDCTLGSQKATMYFSGHPEFEGAGILTVTGNSAHAISAKEYLQLKKSVGTINILGAVKDGIHCGKGKVSAWDEEMILNENEFFLCNGGIVNISNVGGDCIDAGDYGCMLIKGGQLNLNVTSTDACGLKAVNTFVMEDGNINVDVSGNLSDGIYVNNSAQIKGGNLEIMVSGNGSKGIKGKQKSTLYPTGGNIDFGTAKVGIIAMGSDDLTEDPLDPSHCVAISADGNLILNNNVSLVVVGDEARGATCDAMLTGAANVTERMWYCNPHKYQYTMTMYAVLPGADYKTMEVAAFSGNACRGMLEYNEAGYGYLRLYSNTVSGENITFRAYDHAATKSMVISYTVDFLSDGTVGTPSSPIALNPTELMLTVNDGVTFESTERQLVKQLSYVRDFANTNWQPLYVPFSMSFCDWDEQGLEVARLNGFYEYDDDENGTIDRSALEILKVKNGRLLPNHPYLIRAKETGKKTITMDDVTVYPNTNKSIDCFTVETKYTFTGIFNSLAKAQLNDMGAYIMSAGSLRQSASSLKPMRWYMLRESRGGQLLEPISEIKVYVIDEDDADTIHEIADNEQNKESSDGVYRNLLGQKVLKTTRGIVISNGKKIIN